jgi:quinohemoprotein ethanol dehydrogenase
VGERADRLRAGWDHNRGIAFWNGKVYVATWDGRLNAVDARTGREIWSVMTIDPELAMYITGAPKVFKGKVLIGNGGTEHGPSRGYVTAYDAETGEQTWRFWIVPGNPADGFENDAMRMAAETWTGEWWLHGGGGNAWHGFTYDPRLDQLYIGTGNGSPWNRKIRSPGGGDNLFLSSIVALDPDTGEYLWHYQTSPGETWDFNSNMDIVLADLEIEGRAREVILHAPKNGFFYVIDRTDGKLISAEPFARVTWASRIDLATGRPVENPAARYPDGSSFTLWPGPVGAHSWLPMAFSPKTRLAYIPVIEMATRYNDVGIEAKTWTRTPGNAVDGAANPDFVVADAGPLNGTSALLAWDPVAQKKVWQVPTPGPWNGGVMATGGNLVFQGRIDGEFNAYAADSGKRLWSFAAGAPVIAPPITYWTHGRQYVTVLAGMGTSGAAFGALLPVSVDYRTQARRVLTFALDAEATLPRSEAVRIVGAADPGFKEAPASAARGIVPYARRCAVCHGVAAIAAGAAPDLRASAIPPSREAFLAVVRDGRLVARGMPRFEELAETELDDIRQYLGSEARKLRAAQAGAVYVQRASAPP